MPGVTALDDVVHVLMGDLVDAEAVAKMGPDPSSVHVPGNLKPVRVRRKVAKMSDQNRKRIEQAGAGIGVASSVIGTGEVVGGVRDTRRMAAAGSPASKVALRGARRIGGGAVLLTGDVLGTLALKESAQRRGAPIARDPVRKGVPLHKVRRGRLASMMSSLRIGGSRVGKPLDPNLVTAPRKPGVTPPGAPRGTIPAEAPGPVTPASAASMETGARRRESVESFLRSPGGKATVGIAAGGGIYHAGKSRGQGAAYDSIYKGQVAEVEFGGSFSKFDNDKKQAFGWASVVEVNGEPVIDRQGDYIGIDDIEEAAYAYIRKSRVAGDMHRRTETDEPFRAGEVIESVVFTKDKCHAMGLPASHAGKWWIGVQVDDDETWEHVKKRARTGFSIHGKGLRKDTSLDEIRGY